MKKKTFIFVLIITFPFSSIFAEKLTLVTDQYWETIFEKEQTNEKFYKVISFVKKVFNLRDNETIRMHGTTLEKIIIGFDEISNNPSGIISKIDSSENEINILSPLLSGFAESFAAEYPQKKFIIITESNKDYSNFDNIFVFKFDYSSAMYSAGKWAAESNLETLVVFYSPDLLQQKEQDAFLQGWDSANVKGRINTLNLYKSAFIDGSYIRKVETRISENRDISLAVIFAGEKTKTILEKIEANNFQLIAKNIGTWPDSMFNTIGSVEMPVKILLSSVVKAVSDGSSQQGGTVEARFIYE